MKKFFIWKIIYSKSYIQIQLGKPRWTFLESSKTKQKKSYGAFKIWRQKYLEKFQRFEILFSSPPLSLLLLPPPPPLLHFSSSPSSSSSPPLLLSSTSPLLHAPQKGKTGAPQIASFPSSEMVQFVHEVHPVFAVTLSTFYHMLCVLNDDTMPSLNLLRVHL